MCNEVDFSHTEAAAKLIFLTHENVIKIVYNDASKQSVVGTVDRSVYPRTGSVDFPDNAATPFWYYSKEGAIYWGEDKGGNVWQGGVLGGCMERTFGEFFPFLLFFWPFF